MATYWVGAGGNDANDGSTYALRKLTSQAAIPLLSTTGDILNVVGSVLACGTEQEINGVSLRGTSYTSPAFIIQGTDSSGNPAEGTIAFGASNRVWLEITDLANYGIIRGLHFDCTDSPNLSLNSIIRVTGTGYSPQRVSYCRVTPSASAVRARQPDLVLVNCTSNVLQPADPEVLVEYCYIQKNGVVTTSGGPLRADHCVMRDNQAAYEGNSPLVDSSLVLGLNAVSAKMTNCTVDVSHIGGDAQYPIFYDGPRDGSAVGSRVRNLHSNLVAFKSNTPLSAGQVFYAGVFCGLAVNTTGTWSGDVGYNFMVFDTVFTSEIIASATRVDFYQNHYNPLHPTTTTGTAIYPTDVVLNNTTMGSLLNDASVTWTWANINDSGYDIVLPKDYRITDTAAATGALDGGPVGAVEEPVNVPPTVLGPTYTINENVQFSANAGIGLLRLATDPNPGQTLSVTNVGTPSNGTLVSYNITTGSFVYRPDGFFVGDDSFTFQVYDGYDLSTVATAIIHVRPVAAPATAEYVDAAPFFRPTLEVRTEFRMKATKNRTRHHDLANYTEDQEWNESTHRVLNVSPSTTVGVTLGGVNSAQYLLVETDADIDVSINDTDRYWSVSKCVAVALGTTSHIYIRNNSPTNVAQVKLCVVD